ncbi:hypothetical protein NEF87_000499 [Candidatus Lokiarchaeum ossiferum]|uniref:Uncharacterized protein n=1 Tax=Candidatus Lokiarchaeum ossiferum TaxID=2951803 RepID=A0ABY6HL18_9ARCH|nr:hypothetical protein NEF87_000499 [Candidatus Lokiarchaeum sp. B-35]
MAHFADLTDSTIQCIGIYKFENNSSVLQKKISFK